MSEQGIKVRLRRHVVNIAQAPKPLQQVLYTRVGNDIALDVGHFDLPEVKEAIDKGRQEPDQEMEVTLFITDRFIMTPDGALTLWSVAKQIVDDMRKQGVVPPETTSGEVH